MKLVLGIDTGGTYTDAVLYDPEKKSVLASAKAQTTRDNLALGISAAIDALPQQFLRETAFLSLSTTLATNACVEDKGGRAKLIFIGAEEQAVSETGGKYGLPSAKEIFFLDADIAADGTVRREPDWERFLAEIPAFLRDADAVAVTAYQGIRNPSLEQRAKELLSEKFGLFTVCGHELFWSLNYIKRGAGTLLNARLVPVITEFLGAVRKNMEARGLDAPIVIVRSDGSLMSEAFSLERPVETILCGPAASVMGGMALSNRENCLIVDMGGTTTDIALVRNGLPVKGEGGVSIGKWDTFVDSVYIHTIGLGGDSWVRLAKPGASPDGLLLGPQRVMPLCAAASRWPHVLEDLEELAGEMPATTHPLHEFFCLVKDISEDTAYSDADRAICRALRQGALRIDKLARAAGTDLYALRTDRLEREGKILRCGFTPTDAMHIKGDFTGFDRRASQAAAAFLASRLEISPEEFCGRVYNRVKKEVYLHCIRALLENQDPFFKKGLDEGLLRVLSSAWDGGEGSLLRFSGKTPLTLVGAGASTHLFLPDVAAALGAECVIPRHAAVANAVGAVSGRIAVSVAAELLMAGASEEEGYFVCTPRQRVFAEDYEGAVEIARKLAGEEAAAEAKRRGLAGEPSLTWREEFHTARVGQDAVNVQDLLLSARIVASAVGTAGF